MENNFNLHPYQRKAVDALDAGIDLNGSLVLEIGCGSSLNTGRYLVHKGVDVVVCLDSRKRGVPETSTEQIRYVSADARHIPFADVSVDALLGIAVLEHLPEIDRVASEIYRVLKPGGMAYLTGGAFWASHWGHHVYVVKKDVRYCFNEDNNPVPNWGHLLYERSELTKILLDRGVPTDHVEEIVHMIYESSGLNRFRPSEIERAFSRQLFVMDSRQNRWKEPTIEVREKMIRDKNPMFSDLGISELQLMLKKC